ncbi:MAG: hypothetical protein KME07_05165 [Pegethrix bostrychoides GSE-TBD4-15B]|jgi:hypothetical protein|uniref:Uncharacterized protein n=1 Tax=Pegethrix bostrychoides GSE-TBD4-15B TaxID=2839662 RepID=A0A951P8B9_9CYAN|nr:hypothetical protein [Pegethrix bostrychoides GSE-TBD4-15B]
MVNSLDRPPAAANSELLKRPEAVIFIFLAALFVLWDTYLDLLDEVGSTTLSTRQLAQRLGTTAKILRLRKRQPNFSDWTSSLDPDGISWVYSSGGLYTPKI